MGSWEKRGRGRPFFKYIPVSAGSFPAGKPVEKGGKISGKALEKPGKKTGRSRASRGGSPENPRPGFSTAPCWPAGALENRLPGSEKGGGDEEGGKGRRRTPGESAGGKLSVRRVIHSGKRRGSGGFPKAEPVGKTAETRGRRGFGGKFPTRVFHRLWKENAEFSVFHRLLKSMLENVKEQTGKTVWKSCFFPFAWPWAEPWEGFFQVPRLISFMISPTVASKTASEAISLSTFPMLEWTVE